MIIIGADHGGFNVKDIIIEYFKKENIEYVDVSNSNLNTTDDYPDIAVEICKNVLKNKKNLGIAICGTGIGICVACNKVKGIIATTCFSEDTARLAKIDNNSNVLCLGGRVDYSNDKEKVVKIVKAYLESSFGGERHQRRIDKIKVLEEKFGEEVWE